MEKEKKYKRIGWITSVAVQLFMLLLFYFLIAWREPDPPIPTFGIELNFGFDQTGQGQEPVSQSEPVEEIVEEPVEQTQQVEEIVEETAEAVPEVVKPSTTDALPVYEDKNATVKAEEKAVEVKKEVIEKSKPVEQPKKEEENKPEKPKESTPVKEEALMSKPKGADTGAKSQGTSSGTGDEGKKDGTIDGRALYGSQGSADGASLQMAGWVWDFKPQPNDKSSDTGKIVYKIIIDQDGYLSRIDVVSSTVSPEVERRYRQSIERLSFSKTNDYKPASTSTGYVTFIIKTK